MNWVLSILFFIAVISCANNSNTIAQDKIIPDTSKSGRLTETTGQDLNGCYMKIIERDTAILMLEQKGKELSGKMLYDNYQKDGSHGTVKGKEDAGVIKLFYDFNSEGMRSVTEVYFKKENGRLLRGVGDMDTKGDTAYFTSGINYSDKEAFTKVDCNLVKSKF